MTTLVELKTIIVGFYNALISPIDRTFRQNQNNRVITGIEIEDEMRNTILEARNVRIW